MTTIYPISIITLWHSRFPAGKEFAEKVIYPVYDQSFFGISKEIVPIILGNVGIPVFYCSFDAYAPPNFNEVLGVADQVLLLPLFDDKMASSKPWSQFWEAVLKESKDKDIHIVPLTFNQTEDYVSLSSEEFRTIPILEGNKTALRKGLITLTQTIASYIYRIPSTNTRLPLQLFLSHSESGSPTKSDPSAGALLSDFFQKHIKTFSSLDMFSGISEYLPGKSKEDATKERVSDSVLIIFQTDDYTHRESSHEHLRLAKEHNRPIVVLNLLENGEKCSSYFMGNTAVTRRNWILPNKQTLQNQRLELELIVEDTILQVLLEAVRFQYAKSFNSKIARKNGYPLSETLVLGRLPEALDKLGAEKINAKYLVYPDPPVSVRELNRLKRIMPDIQFFTPNEIMLEAGNFKFPSGFKVALSLSEIKEKNKTGLVHPNLKKAMTELNRFLLMSGIDVAYGGSLKYDEGENFLHTLLELVARYNAKQEARSRILNFAAFPVHHNFPENEIRSFSKVARIIKVPQPDGLEEPKFNKEDWFESEDPETMHFLARCFTRLRQEMVKEEHEIKARVFMGGNSEFFLSRYPGLMEEAFYALKHQQPVFLIGAFGGQTQAIIDALHGAELMELNVYPFLTSSRYKTLMEAYQNLKQSDEEEETIMLHQFIRFFHDKGIQSLNNGLSEDENRILFSSWNIPEIIRLILKGLKVISSKKVTV